MSMKAAIARLDDVLRPLGFKRKKANWNRKVSGFIDVIDVQRSKAGDKVTVNAGVLHPGVHEKCWGTEPPAFVQEPFCTVRTRLGQLIDGRDLWWSVESVGTAEDIAAKVTTHVLPFLEGMHTARAMEAFLEKTQVTKQRYPPPVIFLALLRSEQGDNAGACALLSELREKTAGDWAAKVEKIASDLSCQ